MRRQAVREKFFDLGHKTRAAPHAISLHVQDEPPPSNHDPPDCRSPSVAAPGAAQMGCEGLRHRALGFALQKLLIAGLAALKTDEIANVGELPRWQNSVAERAPKFLHGLSAPES